MSLQILFPLTLTLSHPREREINGNPVASYRGLSI
jgi:hypothetical protein